MTSRTPSYTHQLLQITIQWSVLGINAVNFIIWLILSIFQRFPNHVLEPANRRVSLANVNIQLLLPEIAWAKVIILKNTYFRIAIIKQ